MNPSEGVGELSPQKGAYLVKRMSTLFVVEFYIPIRFQKRVAWVPPQAREGNRVLLASKEISVASALVVIARKPAAPYEEHAYGKRATTEVHALPSN